jgi:hypothetical protein
MRVSLKTYHLLAHAYRARYTLHGFFLFRLHVLVCLVCVRTEFNLLPWASRLKRITCLHTLVERGIHCIGSFCFVCVRSFVLYAQVICHFSCSRCNSQLSIMGAVSPVERLVQLVRVDRIPNLMRCSFTSCTTCTTRTSWQGALLNEMHFHHL